MENSKIIIDLIVLLLFGKITMFSFILMEQNILRVLLMQYKKLRSKYLYVVGGFLLSSCLKEMGLPIVRITGLINC